MGKTARQPVTSDCLFGVTAADHRRSPARGNRLGDHFSTGVELTNFKHAHGSVPKNRFRPLYLPGKLARGLRADVEKLPALVNPPVGGEINDLDQRVRADAA